MPGTAAASLIRIVRIAIVVVTIALFFDSTLQAITGHRDISVLLALATPLGISAWGFARAGHPQAGMALLSCVLTTVVTLTLLLSPYGVHDSTIVGYGGIVLLASLLLPRRGFYGITALVLVSGTGVFASDILLHAAAARHTDWQQLAIFVLFTAVFATIGRVASEVLLGTLDAATAAATGDAVTGLANRAGFLAQARPLVAAQRAAGGKGAVVLAEIEDHRRLRVLVGSDAADRVVAEVSRRITANAPEMLVARLAESEFVILDLAAGDEDAARLLAERIHAALAFEHAGVVVRCAVGYARLPRDGDHLEGLLHTAESSLLAAKGEASSRRISGPADRI